jgi:hypothetical protein
MRRSAWDQSRLSPSLSIPASLRFRTTASRRNGPIGDINAYGRAVDNDNL